MNTTFQVLWNMELESISQTAKVLMESASHVKLSFTTATDRKSTMGLDHYSKVQPPPFNISKQNVALRSIVNSARCTT